MFEGVSGCFGVFVAAALCRRAGVACFGCLRVFIIILPSTASLRNHHRSFQIADCDQPHAGEAARLDNCGGRCFRTARPARTAVTLQAKVETSPRPQPDRH